jgi:hypothetical protein
MTWRLLLLLKILAKQGIIAESEAKKETGLLEK